MEIEIFQIDAFTSELFKGNPACVMPLDSWLPDELLLNIAKENNVSEPAFFVKKNNGQVKIIPFVKGYSTSNIIRKINKSAN